jgi:hypothetical protein
VEENMASNGNKEMTNSERYEVRLVQISDDKESVLESREIPKDQLEAQVAQLPNREAMSLVNANIAAPINLAAALNVLSDNSLAYAEANQVAPIQQGI